MKNVKVLPVVVVDKIGTIKWNKINQKCKFNIYIYIPERGYNLLSMNLAKRRVLVTIIYSMAFIHKFCKIKICSMYTLYMY